MDLLQSNTNTIANTLNEYEYHHAVSDDTWCVASNCNCTKERKKRCLLYIFITLILGMIAVLGVGELIRLMNENQNTTGIRLNHGIDTGWLAHGIMNEIDLLYPDNKEIREKNRKIGQPLLCASEKHVILARDASVATHHLRFG